MPGPTFFKMSISCSRCSHAHLTSIGSVNVAVSISFALSRGHMWRQACAAKSRDPHVCRAWPNSQLLIACRPDCEGIIAAINSLASAASGIQKGGCVVVVLRKAGQEGLPTNPDQTRPGREAGDWHGPFSGPPVRV